MRLHVARAAGVGVVAPRPAKILATLKHQEVVAALLLEADRHS